LANGLPHGYRETIVEHETVALEPFPLNLWVLGVSYDSAMKLVDVLKALLSEEGGELLASDASGAIRENWALLRIREVIKDPSGELSERLDRRPHRAVKSSQLKFVIVANV
jgi:hypothetical protein